MIEYVGHQIDAKERTLQKRSWVNLPLLRHRKAQKDFAASWGWRNTSLYVHVPQYALFERPLLDVLLNMKKVRSSSGL